MSPERRPARRLPTTSPFMERLKEGWNEGKSVCLGLDTNWSLVPARYKKLGREIGQFQYNKDIMDACETETLVVKTNMAYYEDSEDGERALLRTVQDAHKRGLMVISDNKLGDIASTNDGYVKKIFQRYGFDALTLNPYVGMAALEPFTKIKGKGFFVMCCTSNPGSGEFQKVQIPVDTLDIDAQEMYNLMQITSKNSIPAYLNVARKVSGSWNKDHNLGLVMGATYPSESYDVRRVDPSMAFLVPGLGAQQGDVKKTVQSTLGEDGQGINAYNASRSITHAKRQLGETPGEAASREITKMSREIRYYRENPEGLTPMQKELVRRLFNIGAIKFGEFRLKKHDTNPNLPMSPVYVDLRMLRSADESTRNIAVSVYAELAEDLGFDVVADVPTGISPIAAWLAESMRVPLITPRAEKKKHGTGAQVDGIYTPGKTIALAVEDIVTSGASIGEAVDVLRRAEITVTDYLALVDREEGGVKNLEDKGLNGHFAFTLIDAVRYLWKAGDIDSETYRKVNKYLTRN